MNAWLQTYSSCLVSIEKNINHTQKDDAYQLDVLCCFSWMSLLWDPSHSREVLIPSQTGPQHSTAAMRCTKEGSTGREGEIPTCIRVLWELVTLVRRVCLQKQRLVYHRCNSMLFCGRLLAGEIHGSADFKLCSIQTRNYFSESQKYLSTQI